MNTLLNARWFRSSSPPARTCLLTEPLDYDVRRRDAADMQPAGGYAASSLGGSPTSIGLLIGSWLHSNQPPS
jgi:hypothetical protein